MKVELILEGNSKEIRRIIDGITMYDDEVTIISEKKLG
jgi:hypothetical protein